MPLDVANQQKTYRLLGKTVIFAANETKGWSLGQWAQFARKCRSYGIDVICGKMSDGTEKWYPNVAFLIQVYIICTSQGVGFIPMGYCYGPRFGLDFVDQECAVLAEMQEAMAQTPKNNGIGFVCADLEAEYNGRTDAATRFNTAMQNKHTLVLTTWADPTEQSWNGVLNIMRGCINVLVTQNYSDWLDSAENNEVPQDINIQPAVDLSQEFGTNHPIAIAQHARNKGETTVWIWEAVFMDTYAGNLKGVVDAMASEPPPVQDISTQPTTQQPVVTPPPPPEPQPKDITIFIDQNDTLSGNIIVTAQGAGFQGTWEDLLQARDSAGETVEAQLDAIARQYGFDNCNGGNLVIGGTSFKFML